MSRGITLHPKFGVNPTLGVCFWCGGDDGTLGLLGANRGREAPHRMVLSLEPCEKCKAVMAQGITLIEAQQFQGDNTAQLREGVHATGRWMVLKEAAVERVFSEDMREPLLQHRKAYLEPEAYAKLVSAYAEHGPAPAPDWGRR